MNSYLDFIVMVVFSCVLAIAVIAGSGLVADHFNLFGFKSLVRSFGVLAFFLAPFLLVFWALAFFSAQLAGELKPLIPNVIENFFSNSQENTRRLNASPYILPAPETQKQFPPS